MKGLFQRGGTGGDADGSSAAPTPTGIAHNTLTRRRQELALYVLGGLLFAGGIWWILAPGPTPKAALEQASDGKQVRISTDDMVNRSMADQEWMALSENQINTQGTEIKSLQSDSSRIDQLQKQIQDLQGQNSTLKADGGKVLSAYQSENDQLRSQISALSTQMQRATAGPTSLYGAGAPGTYQRSSTAPQLAGVMQPGGDPAVAVAPAAAA